MRQTMLVTLGLVVSSLTWARPAVQSTAASDDDLTVVLSVLDSSRRGDDRSFCELRVLDRSELVPLSQNDAVTVRVYEDDPVGDDLVFSLDSFVRADEASAARLDRVIDCSAFFQDSGDAGGSVEIYATVRIEKAQCGTWCLNDDPVTANLIVTLDDGDPGEEDDIKSQATFLVEGLMADEVCADEDWWQFDLSSSASILLEVLHRPAAGELNVVLQNAGSAEAATPTLDHDATRYAVQLDAGSYWLSVAPQVSSDPNFYDVRLSVTTVNGAPIVTAGMTLNYVEGDGRQTLDPSIRVIDDGAELIAATLTVDQGFVSGEDRLDMQPVSSLTATYDPQSAVLQITGSATLAQYQGALRTVTFETPGDNPITGRRRVRILIDDGSAQSLAAYSFVQVQAVNDLPVILQGAPETWLLPAGQDFEATLTGQDAEGDALTWGGLDLPDGAVVDAASGTFFWRPSYADVGRHDIRITVSDGQGTVGVDRSLRVVAVGDGGMSDVKDGSNVDSGAHDVAIDEARLGDTFADDARGEDRALAGDSALPVDRAGGDAGGCRCRAGRRPQSAGVLLVLLGGAALRRRRQFGQNGLSRPPTRGAGVV